MCGTLVAENGAFGSQAVSENSENPFDFEGIPMYSLFLKKRSSTVDHSEYDRAIFLVMTIEGKLWMFLNGKPTLPQLSQADQPVTNKSGVCRWDDRELLFVRLTGRKLCHDYRLWNDMSRFRCGSIIFPRLIMLLILPKNICSNTIEESIPIKIVKIHCSIRLEVSIHFPPQMVDSLEGSLNLISRPGTLGSQRPEPANCLGAREGAYAEILHLFT